MTSTPARQALILVGASGSGKTATGRRVAQATGWGLRDTDAMILERTEATRISDLFDTMGESHFRSLESECIDEIVEDGSPVVVATGGGLPAIPGMMARLTRMGIVVYLKASDTKLWTRLSADPRLLDDRPLLRKDGLATLGQLVRRRESCYVKASVTIDTEQLSVKEVSTTLVAQIAVMDKR